MVCVDSSVAPRPPLVSIPIHPPGKRRQDGLTMGSIYAHREGYVQACANANGRRKKKNFKVSERKKALRWIQDEEKRLAKPSRPALGGPENVTLGGALHRYAYLYTAAKKSWKSDVDRINRYLVPCNLPMIRGVAGEDGQVQLVDVARSPRQSACRTFGEHAAKRRSKRAKTNEMRAMLAQTLVSEIGSLKLREFIATMQSEGLSGSTIRLEMALLKHMFNVARKEWHWEDFDNPVTGLALPKAAPPREVTLRVEDERRLRVELARSESPFLLPYLELAIETTARRGSLLALTWDSVDVFRREIVLHDTKSGYNVTVPVTQRLAQVLRRMPRVEGDSRVLPISVEALDAAWDRACERAALEGLRKHDLRHVGSTRHAKRLRSTTMLMQITGHRTLSMVQRYVKFMTDELLEALDETEGNMPPMPLPPNLADKSPAEFKHEQRVARHSSSMNVEDKLSVGSDKTCKTQESVASAVNVISFASARFRRNVA